MRRGSREFDRIGIQMLVRTTATGTASAERTNASAKPIGLDRNVNSAPKAIVTIDWTTTMVRIDSFNYME